MKMNEFQKNIFQSRYAYPGETTWEECARRVSRHVASAEKNEKMTEWSERFFEIINDGDFIPGGRILYGSGRMDGALLNCFSLGVDDNRHSVAKLAYDIYLISVAGGGVGYCLDNIRPKGDPIQGMDGAAPGVVSEIKKIDAIGEQVMSGGGRRVALLALLSIDHPDVLQFIEAKARLNELNNHNISVGITRRFIEAVRKDEIWSFRFKNREYKLWKFMTTGSKVVIIPGITLEKATITANNFYRRDSKSRIELIGEYKIKAHNLWYQIISNNLKLGEPGLLFTDNIRREFTAGYFEQFNSTNPCGEIVLPKYGSCCLGSVNVHNFYDKKHKTVNWSRLAKVIRVAIRFLDNVLTVNNYPIPETSDVAARGRRVGLGIMGLHYLLIRLGLKYGSTKSIEFIERFFSTFRNEAYEASIELAREKGAFPRFDYEKYADNDYIRRLPPRILRKIKKDGIRNVAMLTIPPTGTTSMIAGVSSGIEPIYASIYKRTYSKNGTQHSELVMDRLYAEYLQSGRGVKKIIGAYDIPPEGHLAVQAAVQEYVDNSISKTINVPADFRPEGLADLIFDFSDHLKGVTIYQTGSRSNEPLQAVDSKEVDTGELLKTANKYTVSPECKSGTCEI